eukprot:6381314-Amphidinium_carterae.3
MEQSPPKVCTGLFVQYHAVWHDNSGAQFKKLHPCASLISCTRIPFLLWKGSSSSAHLVFARVLLLSQPDLEGGLWDWRNDAIEFYGLLFLLVSLILWMQSLRNDPRAPFVLVGSVSISDLEYRVCPEHASSEQQCGLLQTVQRGKRMASTTSSPSERTFRAGRMYTTCSDSGAMKIPMCGQLQKLHI